jgi:hypothetical protein
MPGGLVMGGKNVGGRMGLRTNYLYDRYSPQLAKTLEGMQKWVLHRRHDFGLGSVVGDEIIKTINRECDEYESRFGLRRVYPGQLVWEREVDVSFPGRWCDDSRYEKRREKLIVSRYTQGMIRQIVYEQVPVARASLEQLGKIVGEFLDQGYDPGIEDIVAIGGVRPWTAEEILIENGKQPLVPQRVKEKDGYNVNQLRERVVERVSRISSRKPREIELMADDILAMRDKVAPRVGEVSHGEIVGISLSKHQKKLYRNSMNELRKTVDVVSLITEEEAESLNNGGRPTEVRENQIVRMAKENYEKCKGTYSLSDLALKLGISESRVGGTIANYERKTEDVVPRSGTVFDTGPTLTHKVKIINMLEDGFDLRVVRERTYHTEDAILRYSKRYERVKELAPRRNALEITQRTGISVSEVKAYLEILKSREPDLRIKEYEKEGVYDQDDYERVEALLSVIDKSADVSLDLIEKITGIPEPRLGKVLEELEKSGSAHLGSLTRYTRSRGNLKASWHVQGKVSSESPSEQVRSPRASKGRCKSRR